MNLSRSLLFGDFKLLDWYKITETYGQLIRPVLKNSDTP